LEVAYSPSTMVKSLRHTPPKERQGRSVSKVIV
jgi:hypothetical protein